MKIVVRALRPFYDCKNRTSEQEIHAIVTKMYVYITSKMMRATNNVLHRSMIDYQLVLGKNEKLNLDNMCFYQDGMPHIMSIDNK